MNEKRIRKLQATLRMDALILTSGQSPSPNVYYYSGEETTPAVLVVTKDEATLYSQNDGLPLKDFRKYIERLKNKRIAVDEFRPLPLMFRLSKKNKVLPFGKELLQLREIKEPMELEKIRQAQKITKECVHETKWRGKTENALVGELELKARQKGGDLHAFSAIVTSGKNTSIPHAVPTNNKISQPLLLDVGCRYEHYCGDYSTTIYDGKDREIKDAIDAVKEAKKAAEKKSKPGVSGKMLSNLAHDILVEYGFKNKTFHDAGLSLGHQIGLEVHDGWQGLDRTMLKKGMAFTIEPGIYVKGKYGVRFEDIVIL